jgi:hypothetical protein
MKDYETVGIITLKGEGEKRVKVYPGSDLSITNLTQNKLVSNPLRSFEDVGNISLSQGTSMIHLFIKNFQS